MNTPRVFIAGSRSILRLNDSLKHRIDNIINKSFKVLIGDANGADRAVQDYLFEKEYEHVEIFSMQGACRNNVGNWPIRNIVPLNSSRKSFA